MKTHNLKILAIETSCDETAAALIGGRHSEFISESQRSRNKFGTTNYPVILSNIVSSQVELHAKTGGVVPEVASRAHMESMVPVVSEALIEAAKNLKFKISNLKSNPNDQMTNQKMNDQWKIINDKYPQAIKELQDIDYIAVTAGPGLVGSLLVGFNAAKSLAYALNKPIIAVNHIEGHIYSALGGVNKKQETRNKKQVLSSLVTRHSFPILALTVSGGHTSLTLMKDHGLYQNIGQTLDDAAGEAFDKVAKLLDLGYPGGPIVSRLAGEYRKKISTQLPNHPTKKLIFPRPILNDGTFNFSFSGLKTAVLQKVLNLKKERELNEDDKLEICAAFEDAVVDVLTTKTMRAAQKYQPKILILAGGVAANRRLREVLKTKVDEFNYKPPARNAFGKADAGGPTTNYPLNLLVPPINLCGDNAAMIGLAAYYHIQKNKIDSWDKIKVDSNLEL